MSGAGGAFLTTLDGCTRLPPESGATWLRVQPLGDGNSGHYHWIADANPARQPRTVIVSLRNSEGTIRASATLMQRALCPVQVVDPVPLNLPASGTTVQATARALDESCSWQAVTDQPDWLQVYPSNDRLTIWAAPNFSTRPRTAQVAAGHQQFTLTQQPATGSRQQREQEAFWFHLYGRLPDTAEIEHISQKVPALAFGLTLQSTKMTSTVRSHLPSE